MSNDAKLPKNAVRDFILGIPFMFAVMAAYIYLFRVLGVAPSSTYIAMGTIGWIVALNLRTPFIPLAKKLGQEKATFMMAGLAGPCEELVRLAAVLIFGRTFPVALSIGFGWAAIEILFAIINGGLRLMILSRNDEKAQRAREIMAAQGQMREIPASWFVGAWERLFASGVHIGFTLLVAYNPWLAILLVPVHSLVDLAIPKYMKRSIWIVEGIVTVVGGAALLLGLAVFH